MSCGLLGVSTPGAVGGGGGWREGEKETADSNIEKATAIQCEEVRAAFLRTETALEKSCGKEERMGPGGGHDDARGQGRLALAPGWRNSASPCLVRGKGRERAPHAAIELRAGAAWPRGRVPA